MIFMVQRNYGAYDGYRSPDLVEEIDYDHGYFTDRDKAESFVNDLNRTEYQRYVNFYEAKKTARALREKDYALAVEQWNLLVANGYSPPAPAMRIAESELPEIKTYEKWLAELNRWSDYTWYTVAEIHPA